jgi:hypothetical protein
LFNCFEFVFGSLDVKKRKEKKKGKNIVKGNVFVFLCYLIIKIKKDKELSV